MGGRGFFCFFFDAKRFFFRKVFLIFWKKIFFRENMPPPPKKWVPRTPLGCWGLPRCPWVGGWQDPPLVFKKQKSLTGWQGLPHRLGGWGAAKGN